MLETKILFLVFILIIAEASMLGIIVGLIDIIKPSLLLHLSKPWTITFTTAMLILTYGLCWVIYKILRNGNYREFFINPGPFNGW